MKGPSYCWEGADLILRLYVQPNAATDRFAGEQAARLKIQLQAMALEGAANKRLCQFLAQQFGVRQRQVLLERGARGRYKRVRILTPRLRPEFLMATLDLNGEA